MSLSLKKLTKSIRTLIESTSDSFSDIFLKLVKLGIITDWLFIQHVSKFKHNECQATNAWDHNLIVLQCKQLIKKIQWDMLLKAAILKSITCPHIITCPNASCNILQSAIKLKIYLSGRRQSIVACMWVLESLHYIQWHFFLLFPSGLFSRDQKFCKGQVWA